MILFTAGYLVYDFILYYFLVRASGTLAVQTYVHHILGTGGFYSAIYVKELLPAFGVMSLMLELSTIPLNFRWFIFELKLGDRAQLVNSLMIFTSYLLVRVIF